MYQNVISQQISTTLDGANQEAISEFLSAQDDDDPRLVEYKKGSIP